MKLLLWGLVGLPVAAVSVLTLAGFFGQLHWYLDLASHFRLQYFVILFFGSAVLFLVKSPVAAWAAAGFAFINLAVMAPLYLSRSPEASPKQVYRVVWANVLQPNRDFASLRDYLLRSEADLVLLAETNQQWLDELQPIREKYPFTQSLSRQDHYGIAAFSRIPLDRAEIVSLGPKRVPTVVVWLSLDGQQLVVIGTHPPPPKGAWNSQLRNYQVAELSEYVRRQAGEVMVCGDLNMSPWSPYFSTFLQQSGLRDSARGFGYQPTWPVDQPLLRIPIDHCLVSQGVAVHGRKTGPDFGSDHLPLMVEFSIRERLNGNNHAEMASRPSDDGH